LPLRFDFARPLMLLVVAIGLVVGAVTVTKVAETMSGAKPAVTPGRASSIVWANRVFDSKQQLGRWLRSRGTTYHSWKARYPAAAAVLEHRPPPAPATVAAVAAAPPRTTAVAAAAVSHGGHALRDAIIGLLVAVTLACAAAALLPEQLLARFPAVARTVVPHRELLLAGAAALSVGLLVGAVLT
jgi:hypothetical protein